jgi:hypothetical protein
MRHTAFPKYVFSSRLALARRGHGGAAQAQKELERLALLEKSTLQPATVRAQQTPIIAHAAAAAYLRGVSDRVERVRFAVGDAEAVTVAGTVASAGASPLQKSESTTLPTGGESDEGPQVGNLTQFLSMCKQLKIRYSSDVGAASRRRCREALCAFWDRHASSAVACCYQGVREVGFVADCGLADTNMHLRLPEMWTMLRVLKAESAVASSVDATRILQYLARELQYLESGKPAASHSRGATLAVAEKPSPTSLLAFRQALTDLAMDLLAFFFVTHNPSVNPPPQLIPEKATATPEQGSTGAGTLSPSPPIPSGVAIAGGIDALSGLEVLAVLSATDAAHETITKVWEQRHLSVLRRQREPVAVAAAQTAVAFPPNAAQALSSAALAREIHYLLVSELFRFAVMQRHDLRLTDVVHGFSLLRVHLRTLWPPYDRYGNTHNSNDGAASASAQKEGKVSVSERASSMVAAPLRQTRRQPLWYEKDTLFRVTWGLAVALISKDRRLISPFHYVKIVTTLAKLPAFVLSPAPAPKKELRNLELPKKAAALDVGAAHTGDDERHMEHLSVLLEIPPEQRAQPLSPKQSQQRLSHGGERSCGYVSARGNMPSSGAEDEAAVALPPADFWRFIVSKACVFVPNLPPEQRRVVCRSLHIAITEKRGQVLRGGMRHALHSGLSSSFVVAAQRKPTSKFQRAAARVASAHDSGALSGNAADIILPLVEEMAEYTENYDACIQDARKSTTQSHHHHQSPKSKTSKRSNV